MTPRAYYNEHDKFAAQWLRELIIIGEIADGDVDERSIVDVTPGDLRGYTQCHFFAGIGGWSHALRLAEWDDGRSVWTGSCPCQPFSSAGQQKGFADARHLWPVWSRLLRECRPSVVFGEQVASQLSWLDLVCGDMEAEGYAVGAAIIGAHSVGAPHIRQRLYFVADSDGARCGSRWTGETRDGRDEARVELAGLRVAGDMGDTGSEGLPEQRSLSGVARSASATKSGETVVRADASTCGLEHAESHGRIERRAESGGRSVVGGCEPGGVVDATSEQARVSRCARESRGADCELGYADSEHENTLRGFPERASTERDRGFWADADWLPCLDGKLRPVEPGTFPLVAGLPGRVGRLRGYGNSIVAPCAAAFIRSYLEARR